MRIDMGKCVNCGTCYTVYPDLVNEKWEIIKDNMSPEEKTGLVDICPVGAIIDD